MRYAREDHSRDHFDLRPFIAIMMCVLACLLLVTMSIAALSIGPGVGEGWVPSGDAGSAAKQPVLIEWDGTVAVVHQGSGRRLIGKWSGGQSLSIVNGEIVAETLSSDGILEGVLSDLERRRDTHYALFAVRPSGFATLNRFADVFRDRKIAVGYEPIVQDKAVRLLRGQGERIKS